MSQRDLQTLYDKSPPFIQNLLLNAHALRIHKERYGKKFKKVMQEIHTTQYYTPAEIEEYQNLRLRRIIDHAYNTVPYYRNLFDRLRLRPRDIRSKEDLPKIPVLTRDDVRNHLHSLISADYQKSRLVHGHTSGTTGSPLEFYWDINTCVYNNAVLWRQRNWGGINYRDPIAMLLGRKVVPITTKRPPFWRMNYLHNHLWLSCFHLSDKYLGYYVDKLNQYKPMAIDGYPSTVYVLARYLLSTKSTLPLRAVFTSSETLYPLQKEVIERAFECKVFDYYGLAERIIFATQCGHRTGHHLNFEYGITEFVDRSDRPLIQGESGYIVGTSLQNFGMPFIRYKTSDVSKARPTNCACGRYMPLIDDVTTKAEDIVVTPDGRMISPSTLTHPFKPLDNIEKSQILQENVGSITIKIVRRPGYSESDTNSLLKSFRERLGENINVKVEFVHDIPPDPSGKFRWVISRVPLPIG